MRDIKNAAHDAANIEDGKTKTTLLLSNPEEEKSMKKSDLVEECLSIAKQLPPEHLVWMARLVHSMAYDAGFAEAYKDLISEQGRVPTYEESNAFMERRNAGLIKHQAR